MQPSPTARVAAAEGASPGPAIHGVSQPLRDVESPKPIPPRLHEPHRKAVTPGIIPTSSAWGPFEAGRADELSSVDTSSLTAFVSTGGRLPVLMVTAKREKMILQSLSSLLSCRGITADDVLVVQDGSHQPTAAAARSLGVTVHQKPIGRLRGDGAMRIAQHYGYALKYALETAAPAAPGIIIVEDDFVFSPDFYEYFHAVAPVLEADPSLWLASAWNDNGNRHLARDPYALRRTRYFPGLGWLLPRAVWQKELRAAWPKQHWDHWMRSADRHRGRDVLHPEVARDYHVGVKGTFMDRSTHNKYFRYVGMQADAGFTWATERGDQALHSVANPLWTQSVAKAIAGATILKSVDEVTAFDSGAGLVLHSSTPAGDNADFRAISPFFGIWHEPERGAWEGLHIINWRSRSTVYLLHTSSPLVQYLGSQKQLLSSAVIPAQQFAARQRPADVGPQAASLRARTAAWLGGGGGGGVGSISGDSDSQQSDSEPRPLRIVSPLEDDAIADGLAAGRVTLIPVIGQRNQDGAAASLLPWVQSAPAPPTAPPGAYSALSVTRGQEGLGVSTTAGAGVAPAMPNSAPVSSLPSGVVVVASEAAGLSCDEVCRTTGNGRTCAAEMLAFINTCDWMSSYFQCRKSSCTDSIGPDQPGFVDPAAPPAKLPGSCLLNSSPDEFSCSGKWEFTRRLCPCV